MVGRFSFLGSIEFMPHGHCYFWRSDLITLHAVSDGLIMLAYWTIFLLIAYLIRRRADLPFRPLFWLFGLFIVACGATHFMAVYTIWEPDYWLSGWVKALTAVVSLLAAVALVRALPVVMQLPSPDALKKLNSELERRVQERTADLSASNARLENEVRQREGAEAEVRRLNESLQFRLSELQALLDLLPVGIAIAQDAKTTEMRTNAAYARLTGIPAHRKISLSAPPFEVPLSFKVFQGDRELSRHELPLRRALVENRPVLDTELRIIHNEGREVQVLASAVPLRDADGNARGAVTTLQDITTQKLSAQEHLAVERRLQETQKLESLGVLAGGIAHDFNNLLTGILGNSSLARLDLPPGHAAVRASLDNLEQATLRAADLCKQMLAYAGRGRFVIQPLSLSQLVRDTAGLLEVSIGRKAGLQLQLAEGLPAFQGDATQIRQVLMNIVLNASEALADKGSTITVSTGSVQVTNEYLLKTDYHDQAVEGQYVFVEVSDNGCGMDGATRGKIFDPFFTTKFTGRGLGLPAVLGIVRGHRGAIQVCSEPGKGTAFKVLFPALEQPATPPTPLVSAAVAAKASGTILVVDDEETIRRVAKKILNGSGFEVVVAGGGGEAVEIFRKTPAQFAAVLLDLTMPRMDGEEVFRSLQEINPEVPVLIMSGFNEQDTVNRFVGRGLAGFLPKPFNAEMLLMKLRAVLAGRPG